MAWNGPSGNQDIIYFTYTLYNITSTLRADYVGVRPAMREILLEKAAEFQLKNNAEFGITLPPGGYPITSLHVAFGADMDVANAGTNYSSANIPFGLGYTYEHSFGPPDNWTFDPEIFGPPFFAGTGLRGGEIPSQPARLAGSPGWTHGLRGLGRVGGARSEQPHPTLPLSQRQSQSGRGRPLLQRRHPEGHPHLLPQQEPAGRHAVLSGDRPARLCRRAGSSRSWWPISSPPRWRRRGVPPGVMSLRVIPPSSEILGEWRRGVNPIDSLTGYRGFSDPQRRRSSRTGANSRSFPALSWESLLVAQALFDNGFLLSSTAPDAPDFFLIPGPQPGHGAVDSLRDRDPRGTPPVGLRSTSRSCQGEHRIFSTIQTSVGSMWKATASTAAEWTTPSEAGTSSPNSTMPTRSWSTGGVK